eukprot:3667338-Rhodomonas_salina.1
MEGLRSIGDAMPLVKMPCEKLVAVDWDSSEGFHDGVVAVAGIKNSLENAVACLSASRPACLPAASTRSRS